MGPPAEMEYPVLPVAVATITASARYVVSGRAVDVHLKVHQPGQGAPPHDDVVEGVEGLYGHVACSTHHQFGLKHGALFHPPSPIKVLPYPLHSFLGLQLSHETDSSQVHAQDWYPAGSCHLRRPEYGAVATHGDYE